MKSFKFLMLEEFLMKPKLYRYKVYEKIEIRIKDKEVHRCL